MSARKLNRGWEVRDSMPDGLTTKQREILDFIRDRLDGNFYPPSIREICDHVGLALGTVHHHLKQLERAGLLVRAPGRARAMTFPVVDGPEAAA